MTMSAITEPRQPATRRIHRRSRIVCIQCHQKKIKCDLQANPGRPCSRCVETELSCSVRPSRRRRRAPPVNTGNEKLYEFQSLTTTDDPETMDGGMIPTAVGSDHCRRIEEQPQQPQQVHPSQHRQLPEGLPRPEGHCPSLAWASSSYLENTAAPPQQSHPTHGSNALESSHASGSATGSESVSTGGPVVPSYVGSTGYLHIFKGGGSGEAQLSVHDDIGPVLLDLPPPILQESYLETYFKCCYAWCPILDRAKDRVVAAQTGSRLLQNALGLIGSLMAPPVIPHASPVAYYERAKSLFYRCDEQDPLVALSAIMLFHWWGQGSPDIVSMDTAWWWTGVAIRQAQQLGLHRELRSGRASLTDESLSLRRKIWWTLFARERLTSICTGRPCMINPEDCNIAELTLENDFPDRHGHKAEIFIQWVNLCKIIGRLSQHLSRKTDSTPFPQDLAQELKGWVGSLPTHLELPIHDERTVSYDADVHSLHLYHLTSVTLLYLSGAQHSLPKAYTTAVLASCCVARIIEDFTARGSIRFLQGIVGWSISIAILALLHACKVQRLHKAASAHIRVLRIALQEMGKTWMSARMFERGFRRIDDGQPVFTAPAADLSEATRDRPATPVSELSDPPTSENPEWKEFFPYLTSQTSALAAILVDDIPVPPIHDLIWDWPLDPTGQFHDFFGPYGNL